MLRQTIQKELVGFPCCAGASCPRGLEVSLNNDYVVVRGRGMAGSKGRALESLSLV